VENEQEGGASVVPKDLTVTVGESTYRINVRSQNQIEVDGCVVKFDFMPIGDGAFSLILDGRTHAVERLNDRFGEAERPAEEFRKTIDLILDGTAYSARIDDEHSLLLRSMMKDLPSETGTQLVRAPMPGLIGRIEVEVGEEVAAGKGLLVLEAMKMENEIRSLKRGKVQRIHVEKGKAVEKGEPLVTLAEQ
jgi:biotin carboxyl carrier protein